MSSLHAVLLAAVLLQSADAVNGMMTLSVNLSHSLAVKGSPSVSATVDTSSRGGGAWSPGHLQSKGGNFNSATPRRRRSLWTMLTQGTAAEAPQNPIVLQESKLYLVASFPNLKQVAYLHLPDTVWRPLVIGDVQMPKACASDPQHSRIFVADPPRNKVFWYHVDVTETDMGKRLMTNGIQHVAVEGYEVNWMSVNGVGDLYFTGKQAVTPPQSSYEAVFRVELSQLTAGDSLSPTEVYSRPNSGSPDPKVWMPSGITVDSFFIYWGNQERGNTHGSVVKGSRLNLAPQKGRPQKKILTTLTSQNSEVRGMTSTGTLLFYLTPEGVWGIPKTGSVASLVSSPPTKEGSVWDPRSITFDGFSTAYFTDNKAGKIYSLPAQDTLNHTLTTLVDAPGVHGITVIEYRGQPNPWSRSEAQSIAGVSAIVILTALASVRT